MENQNQGELGIDLDQQQERDGVVESKKVVQSDQAVAAEQKTQQEFHAKNAQFQQAMQAQNAKQAYYIPEGIPVELPEENGGRNQGIISIVCAVISLGIFPPVFGVIGVASGLKARKMGAKVLGMVGIVLSLICMTLGIVWGVLSNSGQATGEVTGFVGRFF